MMLGVEVPGQVLFSGAVTGVTYGVMAVGVILIFRSTRVVNFAIVEMGAFSAALLYRLVHDWGVPTWLSLVAGVAVGALIGAAVELAVIRRLFSAPRVIVLVALIGAAQVLLFFQLILPDITTVRPYPTLFDGSWEIVGIRVQSTELAVLIVIPLVVAAVSLFLHRTKYGLAVRASAANADAARLSAIDIKKMSTLVWALAGGVSAVAAMLFAPMSPQGASIGGFGVGAGMLLRALTAAAIARFGSLQVALAAGVTVGAAESVVNYNYNDQRGLLDGLLFVVVLAALVLGVRGAGGAEAGTGRWSFAPRARPVPTAMRRVAWVRLLSPVSYLVVAGAALIPLVVLDLPSQREAWSRVLLYGLVALSLTVLTGWAGQLSLGQFAFVGLGGFSAAAFVRNGVGFVPAVLLGASVASLAAVVVGVPALRRPGLFLAVATFAFAVMTSSWLLWRSVLVADGVDVDLPRQVIPLPAALFDEGLSLAAHGTYYGVCLAVLLVVLAAVAALQHTRFGRSLVAVRDNERSAAALGISPARVKLVAFAIGGWIAGLAGALLVGLTGTAAPGTFPAGESLRVISIAVIGGLSSVAGAVLGAFWVVGLPRLFDDSVEIALLTSGAGLLILLLYVPGGLVQVLYGARDHLLAFAARRRDDLPGAADDLRPDLPVVASLRREPVPLDVTTVVDVRSLRVRFGGHVALDDVDLHVGRGEVVGLIGSNGAGKSTLMNAIGGFVPSRGRIEIIGRSADGLSPARRARLGLGRSFQGAELFRDLTVREAVSLAVPGVRPWERRARAEVDEVLGFLGLGRHADLFVNELSTGTRRVVELACLLASGARVLCLDEPTAGLAQRESEAFAPLLTRVREELDASMLVVEHDMPMIMAVSDRVYCLEAGRVIAEGTPGEVRNDPVVIASYLGTDTSAIERSGTLSLGQS